MIPWQARAAVVAFLVAGCAGANLTPEPEATSPATAAATEMASPTAAPIASPTNRPSETPNPTPATTEDPAERAKLYAQLDKWLSPAGARMIPKAEIWTTAGSPWSSSISIFSIDKSNLPLGRVWGTYFATLDVGPDVVGGSDGGAYVILYVLQIDGMGNRYFVPFVVARLDEDYKTSFLVAPSREYKETGTELPAMSPTETRAALDRLRGNVITSGLIAWDFKDSEVSLPGLPPIDLQGLHTAVQANIQFSNFSVEALTGNYRDLLTKYPLVAQMVNKKIGTLDPATIPYTVNFKIAVLPT